MNHTDHHSHRTALHTPGSTTFQLVRSLEARERFSRRKALGLLTVRERIAAFFRKP